MPLSGCRFDRQPAVIPAQHAACEVGDFREAVLLEHRAGLSRPAAGAADDHRGRVWLERADPFGQLTKRYEFRRLDMSEVSGVFGGVAHIDYLQFACVLGDPLGINLVDARVCIAQRRPIVGR